MHLQQVVVAAAAFRKAYHPDGSSIDADQFSFACSKCLLPDGGCGMARRLTVEMGMQLVANYCAVAEPEQRMHVVYLFNITLAASAGASKSAAPSGGHSGATPSVDAGAQASQTVSDDFAGAAASAAADEEMPQQAAEPAPTATQPKHAYASPTGETGAPPPPA